MGDVTGPISSLPGSSHTLPEGAMCDQHPDRKAVRRIQGETDSMGCEMIDACQECVDQILQEDTGGRCDWCKTEQPHLTATRDYEEGTCGPVYYVCQGCRSEYFRKLREELDEDHARD